MENRQYWWYGMSVGGRRSFGNNFIMSVPTTRQRNPYLKRILSQQPQKCSYDIEKGRYFILDPDGTQHSVNPDGTRPSKFRPNYSGFVGHKTRYRDAKDDPSVMPNVPDFSPDTPYYTPMTRKFLGYAQQPYQLRPKLPKYLDEPNQPQARKAAPTEHTSASTPAKRKAQSLVLQNRTKRHQSMMQRKAVAGAERANTTELTHKPEQNDSQIFKYWSQKEGSGEDMGYYNRAWDAMSGTKPLPKYKKKTCYNHKCKFLKQWVFEERGETQEVRSGLYQMGSTLGRGTHEEMLEREMAESKLISTMAMSGIVG